MDSEPISAELTRFLHGDIDNRTFRHVDHVRVAYGILMRHEFPDAIAAFSMALKSIARRAGKPGAYHETITVAFMSLIAERCAINTYVDFAGFAEDNADLMEKTALDRWYTSERLQSAVARRTFVLPAPKKCSSDVRPGNPTPLCPPDTHTR
jgi:hypothetical protein